MSILQVNVCVSIVYENVVMFKAVKNLPTHFHYKIRLERGSVTVLFIHAEG